LNPPQPTRLLDPLFTTDRMREIFSDRRRLQRMLDFEAALAKALVATGIAPPEVAPAIEAQCDAARFDLAALARGAVAAGNLAIPMVKALTSLVAEADEKAMAFVHWGATSQDAIDTGLVLQLREALEWIDQGLENLSQILAGIITAHQSTLVAGRTWLQQGPPVTLGLKAAGWRSAIERHLARMAQVRPRVLVLQFGGAVGTLSALEDRGLAVAAALAKELQLELPDLPWHAHRDRPAEVATTLGLLAGSLGKIARDISLMAQTEVGELMEPAGPGRGGSSTMPHKRNPVGCAVVLAAAIRVPALVSTMLASMVQEQERGLGGWHAEWETLPEIFLLTAGAMARTIEILGGLEVHAEKMKENLDLTHGLILAEAVSFALGKQIGKHAAHRLVEQACRRSVEQNRPLHDVLMEEPEVASRFSAEQISRLLDPRNYLGSAEQMTKRALPHPAKGKG
jgi:3-carboxy-cis,cis-muconate cycloisomerase